MKLYSKNPHDRNNKVTFPFVGEVEFDDNGMIDIEDDDAASELVEACAARLSIDPVEADKVKDPGLNTPEGRVAELSKMSFKELKEIAKTFPEDEWSALRKSELVTYLIDKLKSE